MKNGPKSNVNMTSQTQLLNNIIVKVFAVYYSQICREKNVFEVFSHFMF